MAGLGGRVAVLLTAAANRRWGLIIAAGAAALELAGTVAVIAEPTLQRTDWRRRPT